MNIDVTTLEPNHPAIVVMERLKNLEAALLAKDPQMPIHLKTIHQHLIKYEELAHLLSPEELRTLISAQQKHVAVSLVKEMMEKKTSGRAKKAGVDDLI